MRVALTKAYREGAERLLFGVGIWVAGEPHVTAQLDWDRRPDDPVTWLAISHLMTLHRQIDREVYASEAGRRLRAFAHALDPKTTPGADARALRRQYLDALVASALKDAPADSLASKPSPWPPQGVAV